MKGYNVGLIVLVIVLLDQVLKIWIKTTMQLGEEFNVLGDWFRIHFTENPGMAFGLEFAGEKGKLALSIFRIFAIGFIIYIMRILVTKQYKTGLIVCASMILAGAIGNMIDSAFYGMIFSDSRGAVAAFMPEEGGYGSFLQGKVVDMFYFPLVQWHMPEWVPFFGTDHSQCHSPYCSARFMFFRPVFNIADAAITTGVLVVLFFQRRLLVAPGEKAQPQSYEEALGIEKIEDAPSEETTKRAEVSDASETGRPSGDTPTNG